MEDISCQNYRKLKFALSRSFKYFVNFEAIAVRCTTLICIFKNVKNVCKFVKYILTALVCDYTSVEFDRVQTCNFDKNDDIPELEQNKGDELFVLNRLNDKKINRLNELKKESAMFRAFWIKKSSRESSTVKKMIFIVFWLRLDPIFKLGFNKFLLDFDSNLSNRSKAIESTFFF